MPFRAVVASVMLAVVVFSACSTDESDPQESIVTSALLTDGLVAHWELDETSGTVAADSAGATDDDLTWAGTPTPTFATGAAGDARVLPSGNSDQRFFSAAASADLDGITTGVTIAAWYYRSSSTSGHLQDVILFRDSAADEHLYGLLQHGDRSLRWTGQYSTEGTAANAIPLDQWVHLAGTYSPSTTTLKLYINGTQAYVNTSFTPATPLASSPRAVFVGGGWTSNWSANASLDDVRLYDRALSASEVVALTTWQPPLPAAIAYSAIETDSGDFPTLPGCLIIYDNLTCTGSIVFTAPDECRSPTTLAEIVMAGNHGAACIADQAATGEEKIIDCYSVTCPEGYIATGSCKTTKNICPGSLDLDVGYCECVPVPKFTHTDIGTGNLAGSVTEGEPTTVAGSGLLTGTDDTLHFAHQTVTADAQITARISSLHATGDLARVGVMFRDTLSASSRQVFMGLSGDAGYRWVRRTGPGGNTSTSTSGTAVVPDAWVRLVRSGNTITTYKSADGVNWIQLGSLTASFPVDMYVGLAVASGSNSTLNTSQFSDVDIIESP